MKERSKLTEQDHKPKCELCGKIVKEENMRFCCEEHAEEFFRREEVGVEEKTFWSNDY